MSDSDFLEPTAFPEEELDDFEILEVLSAGSHSITYSAVSAASGEKVVIKQGHSDPESQAALAREAHALRAIQHKNVARLRSTGGGDGSLHLVFDFVKAVSLDKALAQSAQQFDERSLKSILIPILDALDTVHRSGFIHRDITPRNILVGREAGAILVDFGSAEPLSGKARAGAAPAGATPGYAPIELYVKGGKEGPWSDIYALAAVAYRALTGAAPPDARARAAGAPLIPASVAGQGLCSKGFLQALDWALQEKPEDRPTAAAEWRKALMTAKAGGGRRGAAAKGRGGDAAEAGFKAVPQDDVPATERIIQLAKAPEPRTGDGVPSMTLGGEPAAPKRGRGLMVVFLLVLLIGIGAGGWWGWQRYGEALKTEWVVDPAGTGDTASLAEALARAPAGATVFVMPGLYQESLVMERPLTIVGRASDTELPRIAPGQGSCLLITAASGSIRGLAFEGGDSTGPCLDLAAGTIVVTENSVSNWKGAALRVRDGASPEITKNWIADSEGTGVIFENGATGALADNHIVRSAQSAVVVRAGATPTVSGNKIEGSGQAGLLIGGGGGGHFTNNEILGSGASGIEIRDGAEPMIQQNRIEGSGQAGIFAYGGGRGEIRENQIIGNSFSGIIVGSGAAPVVMSNEIKQNNEHGILVLDGAGGQLDANKIDENGGHGIALASMSKPEMGDNELAGNREPQVKIGRVESQ